MTEITHPENLIPTLEQIRNIEKASIADSLPRGYELMKKAGEESARLAIKKYKLTPKSLVSILSGKGNNGGDGIVMAMALLKAKIPIVIYFIKDPSYYKGEARLAFNNFKDSLTPYEIYTPSSIEKIKDSTIIVDAMLGIGITGELKGTEKEATKSINKLNKPIISLDIPTGLYTDKLTIPKIFIKADTTISFGLYKISQNLYPTKEFMGEVIVVDIGFNKEAIKNQNISNFLLTKNNIALNRLKRKKNSHKGTYGHVLVVGGSDGMYGAPLLTANASLHSGSGLVSVLLPQNNNKELPSYEPDLMVQTLESKNPWFDSSHTQKVLDFIQSKKIDVLAIGMGLGRRPESIDFICKLIPKVSIPIVIDADALYAFKKYLKILDTQQIIITPHPKEYEITLEEEKLERSEHPLDHLKKVAKSRNFTLIYKTASTIVTTPEGRSYINTLGNPGMAKAGMGDTLTGVIASFLGQGLNTEEASTTGVYIHSRAGDLVSEEVGELSVTSSAVSKKIGLAMKC